MLVPTPLISEVIVMAYAIDFTETCALEKPASRRFYVHVSSLGFLIAAQPSVFREVALPLALSGASRALDQVVEDCTMFGPSGPDQSLASGAERLHDLAADGLRTAFQCFVHLVPPRFGATELLLGPREQINAWCYEDGYLTYATDENAAAIMYAETGSLRRLRSEIRRSPDFDPALQMISGQRLFLFDQRIGIGPGTALSYKQNAARLLRGFRGDKFLTGLDDADLARVIDDFVPGSARTFEGDLVRDACLRRGHQMVSMLLRSLPTPPATVPPAPVPAVGGPTTSRAGGAAVRL
jgi:hypothetical protein